MNETISFGRQWFHPDSQIGLNQSVIVFEKLLLRRDYSGALEYCNLQQQNTYWDRRKRQIKQVMKNIARDRRERLVYFEGMWPDHNPWDNQIIDLLRRALPLYFINVTLVPEEADISIYSCYQSSYSLSRTAQSIRILFLAENIRPSYTHFDISITNDPYEYIGRNIYMPVWSLEIDWFHRGRPYPDRLVYPVTMFTQKAAIAPNWDKRLKRAVYVGNNSEPLRISIIHELKENGVEVDCYGSQSRPISDKVSLLRRYMFNICFENSIVDGYITEKPIHAYLGGCVGIYNGNASSRTLKTDESSGFITLSANGNSITEMAHQAKRLMQRRTAPVIGPLLRQCDADSFITNLIDALKARLHWM